MKTSNTLLVAATLALAVSHSVVAAPDPNTVYFKDPIRSGSGCPPTPGTDWFTLTPDGDSLGILFQSYETTGNTPNMKACNILFPVHVPNGFQVSLLTADYRGFVKGQAKLKRDYFFGGQLSPPVTTPLTGSGSGNEYLKRDNLYAMSKIFSKCGKDVNMHINTRIQTVANNSFISVDTLDVQNVGVLFHLQYQPCP